MNHALNMISLAQKAGKICAGEYLTMRAVKEGYACLVIIGTDTSLKARERIMHMCSLCEVKCVVFSDKASLGHFTGNREKSVIAVTDEGFAAAIEKKIL